MSSVRWFYFLFHLSLSAPDGDMVRLSLIDKLSRGEKYVCSSLLYIDKVVVSPMSWFSFQSALPHPGRPW